MESKSDRYGATPLEAAVVLNRLSVIPLFLDKLPTSTKDSLRPLLVAGRTLTKLAASKGFGSLIDLVISDGASAVVAEAAGNDTRKAFELLTTKLDLSTFQRHYQEHVQYIAGFKDLGKDFDHDGYRLVPPDDEAGSMKVLYDLFSWSYNQVASSVGGATVPTSSSSGSPGSGDGRQALHHHDPK